MVVGQVKRGFILATSAEILHAPELRPTFLLLLATAAIAYIGLLAWLKQRSSSETARRLEIIRPKPNRPPYILATTLYWWTINVILRRPHAGFGVDWIVAIALYVALIWWMDVQFRELREERRPSFFAISGKYIIISATYALTALQLLIVISLIVSPCASVSVEQLVCLAQGGGAGRAGLALVALGYVALLWALICKWAPLDRRQIREFG
jgi:hypothetical protein